MNTTGSLAEICSELLVYARLVLESAEDALPQAETETGKAEVAAFAANLSDLVRRAEQAISSEEARPPAA